MAQSDHDRLLAQKDLCNLFTKLYNFDELKRTAGDHGIPTVPREQKAVLVYRILSTVPSASLADMLKGLCGGILNEICIENDLPLPVAFIVQEMVYQLSIVAGTGNIKLSQFSPQQITALGCVSRKLTELLTKLPIHVINPAIGMAAAPAGAAAPQQQAAANRNSNNCYGLEYLNLAVPLHAVSSAFSSTSSLWTKSADSVKSFAEEEKYDPYAFRDAILQGLAEAGQDLELKLKYLDTAGAKLDYRRYAEALLDTLFAGGILAPGGTVVQDGAAGGSDRAAIYDQCVFKSSDDIKQLKSHYEVLYKLICRFEYLEKSLDEELKKLLEFLKGFDSTERERLAQVVGICLANSLGSPACLTTLFEEHLVKDGLSVEFARAMFKSWLMEKDVQNIAAALKRAGIEARLLDLLPVNKRSQEQFETYFAGLDPIIDYQRSRANGEVKKGVQSKLEEMIHNDEPVKAMISLVKDHMTTTKMSEQEVAVMVWNTIMNAVEWTKKEELIADQAIKHLKQHAALLAAVTESERSQLQLLVKMQDYCYDNKNCIKVFSRIVNAFYKADVLGEDAILKWHEAGHSAKGKTVFLEQTKTFVQWLKIIKPESDEEAEEA